jgi:lysozyme
VLDFCYNVGTGKYQSSTLKKRIDAGAKLADIQREFLKWVYAGGKVLDGLYSRRIWEAARFSD